MDVPPTRAACARADIGDIVFRLKARWLRAARLPSDGSVRIGIAPDMTGNERIHRNTRRPGAPVLVVALEIDRRLVAREAARLREQDARDRVGVGRPGIDHHAVAVPAVLEGERATAFDPALGVLFR